MLYLVSRISSIARQLADTWWAVAVIGLLVGGLVYQQWNSRVSSHTSPEFVKVGEVLPTSLSLRTLDDKTVRLQWSEDPRPTVLYVFQPKCVWCTKNLESIRTVVAHGFAYRFIGMSLTKMGLRPYLAAHKLEMPVYIASSLAQIKELKIYATPETLIVLPSGKVTQVWVGAYGGKKVREIQEVFGVTLPSIARPEPVQATYR